MTKPTEATPPAHALRRARRFTIAFFIAYAIAVVFPVAMLVRGPRPFILGVPFGMAWATAWIIASFFVLLHLDHVQRAAEAAIESREE